MAEPITAFFAAVGAELGGTAGAFLIMNAEALAYTTLIAGSIAISKAQQRRAEAKARDARNAALQDRTEVIRSGASPSGFVFGRALVGGVLALAEETGTLNEYLHLVIAHVRHECDAIEAIKFNDDILPAENVSTGLVETGTFAKTNRISSRYDGTTNGSGVITLPNTAVSVQSVSTGSGSDVTTVTYSHTPPSATVSGLPVSTAVSVNYEYETVTSLVRIRKHLGAAGQVADSDLVAEVPGWTSSDVGVSVCYTYVRLKYDHDVFGSIGIPRVSVILRGMKVYDPRTATTYWSRNAQLCAAAYVLNQTFGLRCAASELIYADQTAYANICDEEVSIYNSGTCAVVSGSAVVNLSPSDWFDKVRPGMIFIGPNSVRYEIQSVSDIPSTGWRITLVSNYGGTTNATGTYSIVQKRYEVNGILGSEDSVWANFESILQAMAGHGVYVQGRWIIRPGHHPSIPITIDESFLASSNIQVVPHRGQRDTFNGVRGQFFDRFEQWQRKDYPPLTSSTYETQDGGDRILTNLDMSMVDNHVQCQRLAKIELLRHRQSLVVKLTTNMKGYDLIPGNVINLTLALFGFSSKNFVVLSREYDFDMEITYYLQETSAATYDWAFNEATAADPSPDSNLPSPWTPPATISNVTLDSGSSHLGVASDGTVFTRVLVSWDPVTDAFVRFGGRIEIEWKDLLSSSWISAGPVTGDRTSHYIEGPTDYSPILVRVLAVSNVGRAGYWAYAPAHNVVGKSAAPPDVTNLSVTKIAGAIRISWDQNPDADRAVTEIRRASTNVWSSGVRVDNGGTGSQDVGGTSYDWAWPPNGSYFIMAKHRDTSGNQSTTHASYAVTIVDGDIAVTNFGSVGGGNFLYNSSFESDSNSDGLSDNWSYALGGTTGSATLSRPVTGVIHGTFAQQLLLSGLAAGTSNYGYLYQNIQLPDGLAGTSCIFSVYMRSATSQGAPRGYVQMDYKDVSNALISSSISSIFSLATSGLERKSVSGIIPANTRFITCYIGITDRTAGTGSTLLIADGAQFELGNVITQFETRADEILFGQVGTTHMALASATKFLSGAVSSLSAGGITAPFDQTVDGVSLAYSNDTPATLDVQVEVTVEHCYMYDGPNMTTAYLQLSQTNAVSGPGTMVFADLLQAADLDTPIPLANPITAVYQFQVAAGNTLTIKFQARCASTSSNISEVNVDAARLRLTAIKR